MAICIDQECTVKEKDPTAQVIVCPLVIYNKEDLLDIYKKNRIDENHVFLFKSTQEDDTDFWTGKIEYKMGETVACPDWDPDPERQCGGGLHLSPSPQLACSYNFGKLKKCKVAIKDFVVYGKDISKVRCRQVVPLKHVDIEGKEIS
jgi:hypothetical protein